VSIGQIDVLDHGYVHLVDAMGNDLSIVRAARVSYNAEWRAGEDEGKDTRLIKYLIEHGHTSPFESVVFTWDIMAPIFVLRQWHRHRTWSYNEVSARYTELPEQFYVPRADKIGVQDVKNKQARIMPADCDVNAIKASKHHDVIEEMCSLSFRVYKQLLEEGCPREVARGVLPLNTYSHMFATVNLHNLFKFLALRLDGHAQYEIRVYAKAMLKLIKSVVPVAAAAWQSAGPHWLMDPNES
jgi:thymidylate synthase (FAD)